MKERNLIVMCGLQCSGKSTKAKELKEEYNAEIISSDNIREEFKDTTNEQVFKILFERANRYLKENKNVIIDATNTTIKMRKQIFNNIKEDCTKECYIMNTLFGTCKERLYKRNEESEKKIPFEVLYKYYKTFEVPFYEEGWDKIKLDKIINYNESKFRLFMLLDMTKEFNQENSYHDKTLYNHMIATGEYIRKNYKNSFLENVAYVHDLGKLFTKTYKEGNKDAHYYNHASIGAYNLMCMCTAYKDPKVDGNKLIYEEDPKKTLDYIFYINYHMFPFNIKSEKSENKWKQIFGESKYNNLQILHEADLRASNKVTQKENIKEDKERIK